VCIGGGGSSRLVSFLQPGQGLAVGGGGVLGQRGLEDRQRLPELHRTALELAQHGEQLLGGAGSQLSVDRLGGLAGDPLAQPYRRTPRHAQRQ